MHCGVMVTGYNQGDWERLIAEDYTRAPNTPDSQNMDDTLYMGELVEPLGFDSIWATEHYGSAYSMQPNPLQYLAYWAGRTSRVDVGTAVIVAPWWNPVRLAHEISMLDILLKGRRLHLGIGRGISPHEYASLGYPMDESHKYFYDVINTLKVSDGAERFEFKGDNIMLGAFLAINMVSGAVLIIPLYRVMMQLGVLNTYLAMIVPGTAFVIPTGIWLLRSYMMRIPRELEEAAWVDGAGRLYTLRRVILPIAMPGIIVVSITSFITAYAQQFLFALTFNRKIELNPLPTGLYQYFGRNEVLWNELMAASLIGILPVMILYLVLQRYIIAGLTAGAIKQ